LWVSEIVPRGRVWQSLGVSEVYMEFDAKKGEWVQILQVVLEPGQRAPQLPKDTSQVPLIRLVKGFLVNDAKLGNNVNIKTVIGRTMTGKLIAVNPGYHHNFGAPQKRFMQIGNNLRRILGNVN